MTDAEFIGCCTGGGRHEACVHVQEALARERAGAAVLRAVLVDIADQAGPGTAQYRQVMDALAASNSNALEAISKAISVLQYDTQSDCWLCGQVGHLCGECAKRKDALDSLRDLFRDAHGG